MLDANRYLGVVLRIIVVLWAGFCPPAFSADKLAIEWRPLFAGVDHAAIHAGVNPDLPLVIQVLRIDLSAEGIGFFTTPSNEDRPLETDSQPTDAFLMEYGLQAAINAAFFSPCCAAVSEPKNVIVWRFPTDSMFRRTIGPAARLDLRFWGLRQTIAPACTLPIETFRRRRFRMPSPADRCFSKTANYWCRRAAPAIRARRRAVGGRTVYVLDDD